LPTENEPFDLPISDNAYPLSPPPTSSTCRYLCLCLFRSRETLHFAHHFPIPPTHLPVSFFTLFLLSFPRLCSPGTYSILFTIFLWGHLLSHRLTSTFLSLGCLSATYVVYLPTTWYCLCLGLPTRTSPPANFVLFFAASETLGVIPLPAKDKRHFKPFCNCVGGPVVTPLYPNVISPDILLLPRSSTGRWYPPYQLILAFSPRSVSIREW